MVLLLDLCDFLHRFTAVLGFLFLFVSSFYRIVVARTDKYLCPDFIGSGVNTIIQEIVLDGSFTRLALLATTPIFFCVSLVGSH